MTGFRTLKAGVRCLTAEDLMALGERLGRRLGDGDIVALHGDLGVGKTTFAKGMARAFHIEGPLTSPTFSIMAQYFGPMNFMHIDAYRLDGREYLGVWDYLRRPCVIAVEWIENLPELRENATWNIQIALGRGGERWVRLR